MGRRTSAWAATFAVSLWALPCGAELLQVHRPLAPPPELPERPAFEELLFSFADPERALEGGFTVPSLSLAVRARAWSFVRSGPYEQRQAWDTLALPAQDVTLSDLPAGSHLASFLDLDPEVQRLKMRDFGPWLRGPDSPFHPFRETLDSMLARLPGSTTTVALTGGVAVLALVHQFGTAQAYSLGLPPMLSGTTLDGRLDASVHLHSEPRFRNARADVATRLRLPELPLLGNHLELLEVGGSAAHTADGLLLDSRWANLRGRLSWLQLSLGVHSNHADPRLWMNLETSLQRERFALRAIYSRQWETARTRSLATATLRTGPVLSGLFLGFQGNVRRTFGLIGMGTF